MVVMRSVRPTLVTGASTGIGRAITELLAMNGHLVYATARKKADLEDLAAIPNVAPIRLDVTRPQEVKAATELVRRRGKGLYGLVNNAGIARYWPVAEETEDEIREVLDVNLLGVHRVTQAVLPLLVKSRGRIVNISSVSGFGVTRFLGSYQMSKHALEAYSDSMALTLRRYGVRISIIEPGNFRTAISKKVGAMTLATAKSHRPTIMRKEVQELLDHLDKWLEEDLKYPTPEAVAAAAMDALFSRRPKRRYMVTPNQEDADWGIKALLVKLVQANCGSSYPTSRKEMHALLDRIWKRETGGS